MKKSRSSSCVNRSKWQAPNALGANVVRNRSRLCCASSASSSTPARWATPASGGNSARIRSSSSATCGLVADVGREGVDTAPVALGDVGDRPLRIRIGRAPAGQHDVTGPELGQMGRRVQADAPSPPVIR